MIDIQTNPEVHPPHPEVRVAIGGESVPVDAGIAPAVRWLNSLPGVRTLHSCQGEPSLLIRPYVLFSCAEESSLVAVFRSLRAPYNPPVPGGEDLRRSLGSVRVSEFEGRVRYNVDWEGEARLREWGLRLGLQDRGSPAGQGRAG